MMRNTCLEAESVIDYDASYDHIRKSTLGALPTHCPSRTQPSISISISSTISHPPCLPACLQGCTRLCLRPSPSRPRPPRPPGTCMLPW